MPGKEEEAGWPAGRRAGRQAASEPEPGRSWLQPASQPFPYSEQEERKEQGEEEEAGAWTTGVTMATGLHLRGMNGWQEERRGRGEGGACQDPSPLTAPHQAEGSPSFTNAARAGWAAATEGGPCPTVRHSAQRLQAQAGLGAGWLAKCTPLS